MWLSADEIERITDRVRPSAQCRRLRKLGLDFKPDADGKPLVLESVARRWGGERPERGSRSQEPNFGALRGAQTPQA